MSTPFEFLYNLRATLRAEGIRFAITSDMACVYSGLQQNTKDSDWIIAPEDLPKLHDFLIRHERRVPAWHSSTPDDLSVWPAELDGGTDRP